jgi:CcmD family protein
VSYAVAAYLVVIAGIAAYAAWLARARRQLERELPGVPERNHG